ncbi:SusC/RagA family TonB-linked outer membrane protein [Carboxylicivirga linearis]|uniref:SusC/RagA family TonB-linked outer membrane protein n=1 Tax=Carboxylicivirga linearis TaxID=1628157 RepID=A0ABS5JQY9_9BACT|nr:SusC/RagA family TonB-linked outer membrane protein [Carboxylicivirga linearis]MBS2097315.1 SusC/RagA family TonB-linked outer membrane protein [Carboxylicivirga linearis]
MRRLALIMSLLLFAGLNAMFAQTTTITGTVTDTESGEPIPGVSVVVRGTTIGTITRVDGTYSLSVPEDATNLLYSFVGMKTQDVLIEGRSEINVVMVSEAVGVDEVVVTALGISREKKSLGYATQEVAGDDISAVKGNANFANALSGRASGVQIRTNNNFGGSTNVVIRGTTSLTGNNQALFVVDGVPINNDNRNTAAQRGGSTGYDYGNAAADINPEDIESINVLKGAAATSLYGSRASNGVVMITTKSGKKRDGFGVTINSGVTIGNIDKSTFISYQDKYGAGYGPYYGSTGYFEDADIDGDGNLDFVVPTYDDGSFGGKFDPNLEVYHWDSFVPESANYGKKYAWQAAKNTPVEFFEQEITYTNSVNIDGASDKGSFRLGYTNFKTNGVLPNSEMLKHNVSFKGIHNFNDKLRADVGVNYINQSTTGRNSTGYSDNLMSQFRQWWQVNVDIKEQERLYNKTGRNVTWNQNAPWDGDLSPLYWDNPYWSRYKNYQTDSRNRLIGFAQLAYDLTKGLKLTAKASVDTYSELQEERRAVGSVSAPFGLLRSDEGSGYQRYNRNFSEYNYDVFLNFNKDLTEDFNLNGIAGLNIRKEKTEAIRASTNGGLVVPNLYSLSNSVSTPPTPAEFLSEKEVQGYYVNASVGFKNLAFVEGSYRYDISSALPKDNRAYGYYSVSGSFLFNRVLMADWLNLGKIRLNYAEVGNDLPALNVYDTYAKPDNFGSSTLFSVDSRKNNEGLKPEKTKSIELGLEMRALNNRVGFDFATYKTNTFNQLIPSDLTPATGYSSKWVNAGEVENKGIELGIDGKPVVAGDFDWEIRVNWSRNRSEVKELFINPATGEPLENIVLASYQGGITVNAAIGQPYGVMKGTGFKYHENGGKIVNESGYYVAEANQIIADPTPDYLAGVTNTLSYKNLRLSFLIDMQKGGDVYSLDMHYGQGTGLPDFTAGTNDKGNPIRDAVADGGGILNPGVKEDGTPNDVYARADYYGGAYYWGNNSRNPAALTVYDASYVKLRDLTLTYNFPKSMLGSVVKDLSLAFTGRNLWIIHKNVPFADPESGLSSGNAQGYLSGSYPTVKQYGFNVKIGF